MNKPTKEQLLEFVNNNNIDYDPVIDDESALRHFKRQRDQYKSERDSLIEDVEKLRYEVNLYTKLKEHIRLKALHNPSVSRYKDLMHFIDELESGFYE
ncbi:hypothetical protein N7L96_01875 [Mammaliicoccus sciuri]|uniref:hypothetical protein n=1 Tax=Mammaliicoccus sciuri TaxID=1296 RepID=UPI00234262B2|nr:hypothetical protein [Mammaliicoccus sciuri]MDC5693336.1 hypothetical protein [Mammaliicoccus sciuri]